MKKIALFNHGYGLFFCHDEILVDQVSDQFIIPLREIYSDEAFHEVYQSAYFIEEIDGKKLYAVEVPREIIDKKDQFYFLPVRRLLETLEPELFRMVCKGKQLLFWHNNSRFCSTCGAINQLSNTEIAKVCSACQKISYPMYSVAIIVLIARGDEVLLARSPHFRKGVYSVLAGFVEPAESAEEAVIREVHEEVGIEIKDIQYISSQNWPFPHSFMLGYTAAYAGGDISINYDELEDASWFAIDKLPPLPSKSSISRQLIDAFIKNFSEKNEDMVLSTIAKGRSGRKGY